MSHVFISYVRENIKVIHRLSEALKAYGVEVWLDRDRIRAGQRWKDAIREAIQQGAFFIACFSKEYHQRSKTYMNEELTLAIEELRQRPTDREWFIPVLLAGGQVPNRSIGAGETLHDIQWVYLSEERWDIGVQQIIAVVKPTLSRDKPDELKGEKLLTGSYGNRTQLKETKYNRETTGVELSRFQAADSIGAVDTRIFKDKVPSLISDFQEEIDSENPFKIVFCNTPKS
jgi:TIR domain